MVILAFTSVVFFIIFSHLKFDQHVFSREEVLRVALAEYFELQNYIILVFPDEVGVRDDKELDFSSSIKRSVIFLHEFDQLSRTNIDGEILARRLDSFEHHVLNIGLLRF